jgi:hypothetical protein
MDTLYNSPVRNRDNDLVAPGTLLLSDFVTVSELGAVHLRVTIESIDPDAEVVVAAAWNNGLLELAYMTETWTEPGSYELSFSRTDIDDTTTVTPSVEFVNRCRAGFTVLTSTQGEDILPWP